MVSPHRHAQQKQGRESSILANCAPSVYSGCPFQVFPDGFITFGPTDEFKFQPRQTWPNAAYNPAAGQLDPPMLAVYYNDADFGSVDDEHLYYRAFNPELFDEGDSRRDVSTLFLRNRMARFKGLVLDKTKDIVRKHEFKPAHRKDSAPV